eukprot:3211880-Alexandrium_andersonii.AAC.1
MSASLVGSEMCIRDRCSLARAYARGCLLRAGLCKRAHANCAAHGAGPVSYTHLTLPTICSV